MTIDPIFVSKPRTPQERGANADKGRGSLEGTHRDSGETSTDRVDISLEARALSGDESMDNATLQRFQRLARQSIEHQRQSQEQADLVKSLLGFGA